MAEVSCSLATETRGFGSFEKEWSKRKDRQGTGKRVRLTSATNCISNRLPVT